MQLVTCLVCGVLLSELHLLCMLLCLKIMKDVVCCCLFCGVPTHQYLLTRLETVIYLTEVYCQLCCRTVFSEPNFKAAWIWVVRAGGRHARPSLVFSNTSCSVASFLLLLANMPGNVIHKVELLSIFIPFLFNHHFVFLFFFFSV